MLCMLLYSILVYIHEASESDVIGSLHELCTIHYSASLTETTIIIMMKTIIQSHLKFIDVYMCQYKNRCTHKQANKQVKIMYCRTCTKTIMSVCQWEIHYKVGF